jgi:FAD/FMN-containing dehydrogenase
LRVALATSVNILLNGLTLGRYVWLEGRVRGGVFRNWARRFRYRPPRFVEPRSEQELAALVRDSRSVRVYGSGHSFNSGVVTDGTLVSLDRYSGTVWTDRGKKQMAVRGGTRVRDVIEALLEEGLAFSALPSHDAQSIAGILSTDVHGTGREWGFVSQSVVSLKVMDGRGRVIECKPTDALFRAAIGGVGAVGIIVEAVVQGVDRFNVEQKVEKSNLRFVQENLDRLLAANEHLSLYLFPFTDRCQINTWNRTSRGQTFLGPLWEFLSISKDALLAAWAGNLLAYAGLLPSLSSIAHGIKRGTNLVLESNRAFNRTIYHLHQELEFTVPFGDTFEVCRRFMRLYEEMYPQGLPYALFEVRFTPAGHERTLIGPGRGRRCTWIDLVCNDSDGFEKYYAAAQSLMKEIGARPHLGKFCEAYTRADLERLHGQHFAEFLRLVQEYDPEGKLVNAFTRRLFG